MLQALVTALRRVLGALIGLLILFEEWGWEPLQRAIASLTRLPPLAWLERCIAALPPRAPEFDTKRPFWSFSRANSQADQRLRSVCWN